METLDNILDRVSEHLSESGLWPFPLHNGVRTEASIRLLGSVPGMTKGWDLVSDLDEGVF